MMENTQDVKQTFKECGTCSQTFAHLLNREFGHPKEMEEIAIDPMAGGLLNEGHQCGMLWGAVLATGAEAFRRYDSVDEATAVAITASQQVVESFVNRTSTVNCREITGYNLNTFFGMVGFMLKTLSKGMKNSPCFNLAEDWAPEAIQSASEGLDQAPIRLRCQPASCASTVARKMGASEEEAVMVAGFAGGLGLSGNACGALAAAIWLKTLQWCKAHPGKSPSVFRNKIGKEILADFHAETTGEIRCEKITGEKFATLNEHAEFIHRGGCEKIITILGAS